MAEIVGREYSGNFTGSLELKLTLEKLLGGIASILDEDAEKEMDNFKETETYVSGILHYKDGLIISSYLRSESHKQFAVSIYYNENLQEKKILKYLKKLKFGNIEMKDIFKSAS